MTWRKVFWFFLMFSIPLFLWLLIASIVNFIWWIFGGRFGVMSDPITSAIDRFIKESGENV